MNFKKFQNIFVLVVLICIFVISTPGTAPDPKNYGGSYNANIGDVAIYNVTKFSYVYVPGYTTPYWNNYITLDNGSKYTYNVTQGMLITFTITNITPSAIESEGFFSTKSVSINGINYTSEASRGVSGSYLNPAFKDLNSSKSYYANVISYFTNSSSGTYSNYFDNDLYHFVISTNTGDGNTFYSDQSWNWKTGWEDSSHVIQKFSNGSILAEYQENLISFTSKSNTNTPGFTIISLLLIPIVVFFINKKKLKKFQ